MASRLFIGLLWLVASVSIHTARAQVVAPSAGGEVNLVRSSATTLEIRFGNQGTGQGRVIAIAPAPGWRSVPLVVTDSTFYLANAEFGRGATLGKGYVVYNGTGHSATITGLQPNTTYYLTDAEYNTDGVSILYNTHSTSLMTSTRLAPAASPPPAPLPVVLTSFSGAVDAHGAAVLSWTTASEDNAAYFALERSADGDAYTEAGRVAAHGTNSQSLAYQWLDPQLLAELTYYRLRQADLDGTVHYSSVVALSPPHLARSLDVYPSPSTGQVVQVLMQGFARETLTLNLADALGRQVMTQTLTSAAARYQALLPTGLAPGTYFLTLISNGSTLQKRLVISE